MTILKDYGVFTKNLPNLPPETVNIKKIDNLAANTKSYGQITRNTKPHSNQTSPHLLTNSIKIPPKWKLKDLPFISFEQARDCRHDALFTCLTRNIVQRLSRLRIQYFFVFSVFVGYLSTIVSYNLAVGSLVLRPSQANTTVNEGLATLTIKSYKTRL